MSNTKFRLLEDDTIELWGRTLHRIEALKDFSNIQKGEKGGYVEKEGNLGVSGNAWVYGDAWVYGNAEVYGNARVYGNAEVSGDDDLLVIYPIGSEDGILTAFKNKEGSISVTRGCFKGTLKEFESAVEETHGDNEYAKTYHIAVELIKNKLGDQDE